MRPEIRVKWAQFRESYKEPHFASASTQLRPEDVAEKFFGHHSSVVVERGTRVYMFEGQKNRDRFVDFHRHLESKPCQDPLP